MKVAELNTGVGAGHAGEISSSGRSRKHQSQRQYPAFAGMSRKRCLCVIWSLCLREEISGKEFVVVYFVGVAKISALSYGSISIITWLDSFIQWIQTLNKSVFLFLRNHVDHAGKGMNKFVRCRIEIIVAEVGFCGLKDSIPMMNRCCYGSSYGMAFTLTTQ